MMAGTICSVAFTVTTSCSTTTGTGPLAMSRARPGFIRKPYAGDRAVAGWIMTGTVIWIYSWQTILTLTPVRCRRWAHLLPAYGRAFLSSVALAVCREA